MAFSLFSLMLKPGQTGTAVWGMGNCFPSECSMPQRVGDWGNGFMPCGEDEGESALASYRSTEAVFPVAGMIPYTKGGLSMVRSLARRLPA